MQKIEDPCHLNIKIDVPPPYTSGILHIGHAYQYIPIDVLKRFCKYKNIKYSDNFGFDVHGLPVELKVRQKEKNVTVPLIKKFVTENIKKMLSSFKKLKINIKTYWTTDDYDYKLNVNNLLLKAYQQQLLQVKNRVNYYCIYCKTNLSKSEIGISKIEKKGYYIKFYTDNKEYTFLTTRPELLFNGCALFVNPTDERYLHLHNKIAYINYNNLKLPIFTDTFVKINYGTGILFVAAYGNLVDSEYINRHNLIVKNYIDCNGFCNNLFFDEFYKNEIKKIEDSQIILKSETVIANVYLHTERSSCKKEIHFISSPQIYIKTSQLKEKIINVISNIEFKPSKYKNELLKWCENLDDWCISRQNLFGTNFNFYVNYDTYAISFSELKGYVKPIDVCDCWVDSSITFILNNANIRFQGYEINRTWLLYSIISSIILDKKIFEKIRFTSLVLGENRKKISKSTSTDYSIDSLLKKYNCNLLRLWCTKTFTDADSVFTEENIKKTELQVIKLKNIFNFFKINKTNNFDENNFDENIYLELKTIFENYKSSFDLNLLNLNFTIYESILSNFVIKNLSKKFIPIFKQKNNKKYMSLFFDILKWLAEIFEIVMPADFKLKKLI